MDRKKKKKAKSFLRWKINICVFAMHGELINKKKLCNVRMDKVLSITFWGLGKLFMESEEKFFFNTDVFLFMWMKVSESLLNTLKELPHSCDNFLWVQRKLLFQDLKNWAIKFQRKILLSCKVSQRNIFWECLFVI